MSLPGLETAQQLAMLVRGIIKNRGNASSDQVLSVLEDVLTDVLSDEPLAATTEEACKKIEERA